MNADIYARIAERYQVPGMDDEAIERFFLDVAPTLAREDRDAIVAELVADEIAGMKAPATTEVPSEVPTFPIVQAPPVVRPSSLAQLVGELSAAVEKRVGDRVDTVITRALDRLQESATSGFYGQPRIPYLGGNHLVGELIEEQTLTVIAPGWTVRTAAQHMAERNVGTVPVVDNGMLAGVFSKRDLMERVIAKGLDPDNTSVSAVMTREIVVIEPEDDLDSALRKMYSIGSRHLPVVRGGKLIGMISIRDLPEMDDDAAAHKARFLTELIAYSPDYER